MEILSTFLFWLLFLPMLIVQAVFFAAGLSLNALFFYLVLSNALVVLALFAKGLSPDDNCRIRKKPVLGYFILILCTAISICLIFPSTGITMYLLSRQFHGKSYFVHSAVLDPFLAFAISVGASAVSCFLPMWYAGLRRRDLLCVLAFPVILQLAGGVYVYHKTVRLARLSAVELSVPISLIRNEYIPGGMMHIEVLDKSGNEASFATYVVDKDTNDGFSEYYLYRKGEKGWEHIDTSLTMEDYRKYIPWPVYEFADMK